MNLSSFFPLLRLLSLPIIIYFLLQEDGSYPLLALITFIFSLSTKIFEEHLLKGRQIKVGSFLDPFADKIFIFGLLFFLVWKKEFSLIFFALLALREIFVAAFRYSATREDIVLDEEAANYAQTATWVEFILILELLVNKFIFIPSVLEVFLAIVAILFAWSSLGIYVGFYLSERARRRRESKESAGQLIILANKRSRGYHDLYRRRLLKVFARRRKAPIYYLPSEKNMFLNIEAAKELPSRVIIAGGDGSFESALNHKPFWKKSLGFFPLGAGNAFYSYFYRGKRFEYLRSRFHFQESNLDVLELTWERGKRQTTFLSLGLDAEIIHLSKRTRQAGLGDYFVAGVKGARLAKAHFNFQVLIDNEEQNLDNCVTLTLAKIPYFGFALRSLLGKVDPADGDVYGLAVVNTHPKISNKAVRLWALLFANFNLLKAPFAALKGRKIEIKSSEPFPLQAGGEFLGYTSWVKIKVIRKQKVLMV